MRRRFDQVDVFTDTPLLGNPLAVVHDADDLSDETMLAVARFTNLSETTFLMRPTHPDADYRVRIFTPTTELPFAGHPTLGSCFAYRRAANREDDVTVQECGVGLVRVHARDGRLAFEAPPLARSPMEASLLESFLTALGLPRESVKASAMLTNGPTWFALLLDSPERVLGLEPDHALLAKLGKIGVVAPYPARSECAFEVRAFASAVGIPEDPVTGSLQASLADFLIDDGYAPASYVAAQGQRLHRRGRVYVDRSAGTTRIGGYVAPCVTGTIDLPPDAR